MIYSRETPLTLRRAAPLFFGLLLIYPFNVIAISSIIYLLMLPISFFHYKNLKKQHTDSNSVDDDDLEDVL